MARSTCIYGATGSRKTTQAKYLARYVYQRTGKATLLLSTDGGGWEPCEPEIQAGLIRPYRVETAELPMIILRKLSQGFWPVDPLETNPGKIDLRPVNWSEIGGYVIEGWSSISQVIMRYLPDKGINVGGEDRNKLGGFNQSVRVDGQWSKEDFRSNTRGDYGFVQNHLYGLVTNFNSLPVADVLHTALESKTEDDDRSTIFGPQISGKKATAACGSWVGNLIHAQDYIVPRKVSVPDPSDPTKRVDQDLMDTTVRFYFKKHPDPATGIFFPAKPRLTPEKIADLDKRFPGGYFEPATDGRDCLDAYLETLDKLAVGQGDELKTWRDRMDSKLGRGAKPASAVPAKV
jgi:hypothetical protein